MNQPRPKTTFSRREIIAAASAGIATTTLGGSAIASAASTGKKRHLYVTNNPEQRVDIFDINDSHRFLRSFPMVGEVVGGACADAASGRFFISQQKEHTVSSYDLLTGEVLWVVNTMDVYEYGQPDRISITADGRALYVPMKRADKTLILDTASGERIAEFERPGRPHNSWSGESGKYMYVAGRSHPVMYVADQRTHKVVKKIGPFRWPIRPFAISADERYLYANLTYTIGFGVADLETGELNEIEYMPPTERTQYWDQAKGGLPHGDDPYSHGIGVRPDANEVWYIDDQWGYLFVFDTSKDPMNPTFKRQVELFDEIDKPWGRDHGNRWVAFSIDGKYCYPSDGLVVDAEAGEKTDMRISPSEKLVEVEFVGDTPVRVSGQMGGVYGIS